MSSFVNPSIAGSFVTVQPSIVPSVAPSPLNSQVIGNPTPTVRTLPPKVVRTTLPPQYKTQTLPPKVVRVNLPPIGTPAAPPIIGGGL